MLALSRKSGQGIVLDNGGQRVELIVTDITGNRVTIAIAAPKEVKILRSELDGQWPLGIPATAPKPPITGGVARVN